MVLEASDLTPVGTLTVRDIDPSQIHLANDGAGGTDITLACFAPETRIATPSGPIQIQHLRPGDLILTASGETQPVTWIGHRTLDLTRHADPATAQPIRLRRDAFGPEKPNNDLRLSPDHALLIDNILIPARLLLNNATITQETTCTHITYFHLELPRHDILLAENLPAESYLDTGSRGIFENAPKPLILRPDLTAQQRRETESCAPAVAAPDRVQPIWQRLRDRAAQLGHTCNQHATTIDPNIRIETAGRTLAPAYRHKNRYSFILPPGATSVQLLSRSAKPNETKPWLEDRRTLGLMISRITLQSGCHTRLIALDNPRLTNGWHAPERDHASLWRWTNGRPEIPIPSGAITLEIVVAGPILYALSETGSDRVAVAA